MEAIILGNPYSPELGSTTPIEIPAYTAEEAVVILSDGYNPYLIGSTGSTDSYWFRYDTGILTPLTSSDRVVIGASSFVNTELFRVSGKANFTSLQLGASTTISSILDEDNMVSNSNTAVPTQQSVKAYVDNQLATSGIQIGDNISLLTNDSGYITSETDPIFVASDAYAVTSTGISHWNTAYGWGNHASAGYLTSETDPVFVASEAYTITSTDTTHWDTAYTNNHTHSNKTLLDSLTSAGGGTQALFNDGTYKTVLTTIAGSTNQVQYNISGALSASSSFTYTPGTTTLSAPNIIGTTSIFVSNASTYLSKDGSNNLVLTDAVSGSVTLATLLGGATNYWTTISGGIYYTNYVGVNNPSSLDEALTVNGNIQATNFNSTYFRYTNSNLLLGPNAGDNETGSDLLYIANTNTATPLIKGDFLNQSLEFNADTYINTVKRLCFGDSTVTIHRDSSNNLLLGDPNTNSGVPVTLSSLVAGAAYALKADFISYASATSITAANLATWGKASILSTSGSSSLFLAQDGTYQSVPGGVTPTDNFSKWDSGSSYYRFYTDKTEAGGVSSSGKMYLGTSNPSATNRLNYDGYLYATKLYSNGVEVSPMPSDNLLDWNGTAYAPYSSISDATLKLTTSSTISTYNVSGILTLNGRFYTGSSNTSYTGTSIYSESYGGIALYGGTTTGTGLTSYSVSGTGLISESDSGVAGKFIIGSGTNIVEYRQSSSLVSYITNRGKYFFTPGNLSTTYAVSGGCLKDFYTDVSTTGTGSEEDLYSYTIPANTLYTNGDKLEVTIGVTCSYVNRGISVYFAGDLLVSSVPVDSCEVFITVLIIRTGSSTARSISAFYEGSGNLNTNYASLTSKTWSSSNIFKVTGTGDSGTPGDITARLCTINYIPAAIN